MGIYKAGEGESRLALGNLQGAVTDRWAEDGAGTAASVGVGCPPMPRVPVEANWTGDKRRNEGASFDQYEN